MDGRGGPDVYEGGTGTDTVTYGGSEAAGRHILRANQPVNATIDEVGRDGGAQDRNRAGRGDDIGLDVEKLIGGSANDTLIGGDADDQLVGGDGDDFLSGRHGMDQLDGGPANDRLQGGGSDDSLTGGAGGDSLDGWTGNDALDGGPGDDSLDGGPGNDSLTGGDGIDTADYSGAQLPLRYRSSVGGSPGHGRSWQ